MSTVEAQSNAYMVNKETQQPLSTMDNAQTGATYPTHGYNGNKLTHANNNNAHPAFGGAAEPGQYRPAERRKFANPAPLGLSAFALTTFVLSLINMRTRNVASPNIVVAIAFGYGGLVQLLAGMWEFAVGNTFGALAFSSYGGFWLAFGIILTPGGFQIVQTLEGESLAAFHDSFGFFLMGWLIFTTLLLLCTLRSNLAFFLLFFFLEITFLLLGIGYLHPNANGTLRESVIKAGGFFGLLTAFVAWYNALAGLMDHSNSFFTMPVVHFPWSDQARQQKAAKSERATV
ncbi:MAG: hypothetical protein M1816_000388 [Peltula sp. TS41687]|nr:MAG: hypothetical protein M1816_000388 [Peltula sp. TS41687]